MPAWDHEEVLGGKGAEGRSGGPRKSQVLVMVRVRRREVVALTEGEQ